jgi:hypothetical protein
MVGRIGALPGSAYPSDTGAGKASTGGRHADPTDLGNGRSDDSVGVLGTLEFIDFAVTVVIDSVAKLSV